MIQVTGSQGEVKTTEQSKTMGEVIKSKSNEISESTKAMHTKIIKVRAEAKAEVKAKVSKVFEKHAHDVQKADSDVKPVTNQPPKSEIKPMVSQTTEPTEASNTPVYSQVVKSKAGALLNLKDETKEGKAEKKSKVR